MYTSLKSWKTTTIGLLLIGAGIYTGVTAKTSWTESNVIILAGVGLVCSKDHNK